MAYYAIWWPERLSALAIIFLTYRFEHKISDYFIGFSVSARIYTQNSLMLIMVVRAWSINDLTDTEK